MNIIIITNPNIVDKKAQQAALSNPNVTIEERVVRFNNKRIAHYVLLPNGVEITVTDRPWYISEKLIEARLRALFD